jgi:hypothetical protein
VNYGTAVRHPCGRVRGLDDVAEDDRLRRDR